jgi:transcriptional regulator with XRE-family HTH domain
MSRVYPANRAQAVTTGARIRALMRKRGVSTARLAANLRIQRSTLENFCAGHRIPSDLLIGIARELATSVDYLTAASDDPGVVTATG